MPFDEMNQGRVMGDDAFRLTGTARSEGDIGRVSRVYLGQGLWLDGERLERVGGHFRYVDHAYDGPALGIWLIGGLAADQDKGRLERLDDLFDARTGIGHIGHGERQAGP
ncbi:hypothetical protein D3C76_827430 [compost metagenome]